MEARRKAEEAELNNLGDGPIVDDIPEQQEVPVQDFEQPASEEEPESGSEREFEDD
jgi:hypothetical protein